MKEDILKLQHNFKRGNPQTKIWTPLEKKRTLFVYYPLSKARCKGMYWIAKVNTVWELPSVHGPSDALMVTTISKTSGLQG